MLSAPVERTRHYFDSRAERYSQSYQRCGWNSVDSQYRRFWALTHHFDLSDSLVLDAGCGDGEFYEFAKENFPTCRYVGIDVSDKMLTIARQRFPKGIFMTADVLAHSGDYDYVICSGAFNLKVPSPNEYLAEILRNLFKKAQVGVSISLLSEPCDTLNFYNPGDVFKMARQITPYVDINHTYADNDFSVTLFRR